MCGPLQAVHARSYIMPFSLASEHLSPRCTWALRLVAYKVCFRRPSFEVRSIRVVDHNGYPSLKILLSTSAYPITFHLLTPEGEEIGSYTVEKSEEAVYLDLPGPSTNIIGPKTYCIKAFYEDLLPLDYNTTIKGSQAYLKIVNVTTRAEPSGLRANIIAEVENMGDVPLYLNKKNSRRALNESKVTQFTAFPSPSRTHQK